MLLNGRDALVYVSDADEVLDVDEVLKLPLSALTCVAPRIQGFLYGVACPVRSAFQSGTFFRMASGWFNSTLQRDPKLELHKVYARPHSRCPLSANLMGWHLSYFMDTPNILLKLRSTSHANEPTVRAIWTAPKPDAAVDAMVATCKSPRSHYLPRKPDCWKNPPMLSHLWQHPKARRVDAFAAGPICNDSAPPPPPPRRSR